MVLQAIDSLHISQDHRTVIVLMDPTNIPSWQQVLRLISSNYSSSDNIVPLVPIHIGAQTRNHLLIFSDEMNFNKTVENMIVDNLKSTLFILNNSKFITSASSYESVGRSFCCDENSVDEQNFYVANVAENETLRLVFKLELNVNNSNFDLIRITNNFDEWLVKHRRTEECEGCEFDIVKAVSLMLILGCSCLILVVMLGVVAFARTQLLRKNATKGPYKVILTATDFVFPQITDAMRVRKESIFLVC